MLMNIKRAAIESPGSDEAVERNYLEVAGIPPLCVGHYNTATCVAARRHDYILNQVFRNMQKFRDS